MVVPDHQAVEPSQKGETLTAMFKEPEFTWNDCSILVSITIPSITTGANEKQA